MIKFYILRTDCLFEIPYDISQLQIEARCI